MTLQPPSLPWLWWYALQVAGFETFHETVSALCTAVVSAKVHGGAQINLSPRRFQSQPSVHSVGSVSLRGVWRKSGGAHALHNSIVLPLRATYALFRTFHAVLRCLSWTEYTFSCAHKRVGDRRVFEVLTTEALIIPIR